MRTEGKIGSVIPPRKYGDRSTSCSNSGTLTSVYAVLILLDSYRVSLPTCTPPHVWAIGTMPYVGRQEAAETAHATNTQQYGATALLYEILQLEYESQICNLNSTLSHVSITPVHLSLPNVQQIINQPTSAFSRNGQLSRQQSEVLLSGSRLSIWSSLRTK